ncbi:hypothetical protein FQ707_14865 [Bacteroidaceae bacterium HV4-6-C5C]|nr:hypothetical protein FQ707_14865 [Bacteroidaceae bacterium HV4-6-C5C]
MKNVAMIPNYYAYRLTTNGRDLSEEQRGCFFHYINKIYRNNDKFIYIISQRKIVYVTKK